MKSMAFRVLAVLAGVMLLAATAPATRGQTLKKTAPPKDTGLKDRAPKVSGKADFCFASVEGVGPAKTADPNGDGCLMQQEFTFGIKNNGVVDAPSSVVQFTVTNSQTKEKRVVNRRISVLKPGQVVTVTFKFSIVADGYVVKLDAKSEVNELKEGNNQFVRSCEGGVYPDPCN